MRTPRNPFSGLPKKLAYQQRTVEDGKILFDVLTNFKRSVDSETFPSGSPYYSLEKNGFFGRTLRHEDGVRFLLNYWEGVSAKERSSKQHLEYIDKMGLALELHPNSGSIGTISNAAFGNFADWAEWQIFSPSEKETIHLIAINQRKLEKISVYVSSGCREDIIHSFYGTLEKTEGKYVSLAGFKSVLDHKD